MVLGPSSSPMGSQAAGMRAVGVEVEVPQQKEKDLEWRNCVHHRRPHRRKLSG